MKGALLIVLSVLAISCADRTSHSVDIQITSDLELIETTVVMLCSKRAVAYSEMKKEESKGRLNAYITGKALMHELKKNLRLGRNSSNDDVVVDPHGRPYTMKLEKGTDGEENSTYHEPWLVVSAFDEEAETTKLRTRRIKLFFRR